MKGIYYYHIQLWSCVSWSEDDTAGKFPASVAFTVYEKLDYMPSSCIMGHMVKGRQYSVHSPSHIDANASITEMESETDSWPRYWQISITGDELDSATQLKFWTSGWLRHGTQCACHIIIAQNYLYLSTGLRQPLRKCVKFSWWYLSEKVALSL